MSRSSFGFCGDGRDGGSEDDDHVDARDVLGGVASFYYFGQL